MALTADPTQEYVWLVEAQRWDDTAGAAVWEYLATRDLTIAADDPTAPNREYEGRIVAALQVSRRMFADSDIGGRSLPDYGSVDGVADSVIVNSGLYRAWQLSGWRGWGFRVLRATLEVVDGIKQAPTDYAAYEQVFGGVSRGPHVFGLQGFQFRIADLQARLEQAWQTSRYLGTGAFEGTADLKGKYRPDAVGVVRGVSPVAVDFANLWWDCCASGFHSVTGVWDGQVALTVSLSNPPPAGHYFVDAANGRIRTGSKPTIGLTVDFRSAFGTSAQSVSAIVSALLSTRFGFSAGEIDSAALTALETLNGAVVGSWSGVEGEAGLDLLDRLFGAIGAFYTTTLTGALTAGRVDAPTATSEDDPAVVLLIDDTDIERGQLTVEPAEAPPWRIEIGYRRNWTPITDPGQLDEVNTTAAQRAFATEQYRVEASERSQTKTKHKESQPFRRDTVLDLAADAATEATRVRDLIAVDRTRLTVRTQLVPGTIALNDQVWVDSPLYGITGAFRVIGLEESARDGRTIIRLWG